MQYKTCIDCEQSLPLLHFSRRANGELRAKCEGCLRGVRGKIVFIDNIAQEPQKDIPPRPVLNKVFKEFDVKGRDFGKKKCDALEKECRICAENKPIENFYKQGKYFASYCKTCYGRTLNRCKKGDDADAPKKNIKTPKAAAQTTKKSLKILSNDIKICKTCKAEKPLSDYYMAGKYPESYCKSCSKKISADNKRKRKQAKKECPHSHPVNTTDTPT